MPNLARYLQEAFERSCPKGWRCRTEARVVSEEVEELLGYAPQADAVLQEVATGRRVWVELEVSRALCKSQMLNRIGIMLRQFVCSANLRPDGRDGTVR